MQRTPINSNSTLRLIQTINHAKQSETKSKLNEESKLATQMKEEINHQLLAAKNKLKESHLDSKESLQLLDDHPKEAFILACAISELKEEKTIAEHRQLLHRYPNYAFDIVKIISLLKKNNLMDEDNWNSFKESETNIIESYYLYIILKNLSEKSLLNKDNFDLVCDNANYATQICSVLYTLKKFDQDAFQKLMRFADKAGFIATRLAISGFTTNEIAGDLERFDVVIEELSRITSEIESKKGTL